MTDFVSSSVALPGASSMPWVEKYRPRSINDVAQQEQVVKVLRRSLVSENLPHLLFYGPPGTGKTSTILALARDLYGPLFRQRVLELNASDERGIRVIREKVQVFASTYVSAGATVPGAEEDMDTDEPGRAARRVPPFKLIILDEADSMTADAQAALRRVIEVNARTTRFCLVCNYVSRIIEPLASRCAKFRFQPLDGGFAKQRLLDICAAEGVTIEPVQDDPTTGAPDAEAGDALDVLLQHSEGDMRRAIITLQTCSRLAGDEPLKASLIVDALGVAPLQHVLGAAAAVRQDRRMDALVAFSQGYLREGRSTLALLEGISRAVAQSMPVGLAGAAPLADAASTYGVHYAGMSNFERAALAKRLAQAEKRLAAGASEFLQLMDVLSYWLQFVQLQST